MSVTFESAVATLKSMFPEWDEETLSALLVSNNYHVEHTIETVLSMGDTGSEDNNSGGNNAAAAPSIPQRAQSPPAPKARSNVHSPAAPAPSSSARYRGTKCDLPNDFLRPPSFQNHVIIADEELALMLQNELFQQQARQMLGDNFMDEMYAEQGAAGARPANRRATSSRVAPQGSGQQQQSHGTEHMNQDMGIMKTLNSMGSAAKRNLSSLAASFKSSNNTNQSGNSQRSGSAGVVRRGSGTGRKKGAYDDMSDDEGGTEIITFSSNQGSGASRHMLNQDGEAGGYGVANTDDEDLDAENPLLQYKNTNNLNIPPPAHSATSTRI